MKKKKKLNVIYVKRDRFVGDFCRNNFDRQRPSFRAGPRPVQQEETLPPPDYGGPQPMRRESGTFTAGGVTEPSGEAPSTSAYLIYLVLSSFTTLCMRYL